MKILYINIDIGKFYIRDLQKMGKVTLARYITQRGIVQKIKQGKSFQGNIITRLYFRLLSAIL